MVNAKYIIKQPTELITKGSKRKTETRNLVDFYAENHDKIMIPAMQREANAWKSSGPSFLIDSILRGYDIPKFYIKVERINGKNTYFMIDGQQRWNSIDKFLRNKLKLPSNAPPIILPDGKIVNIADRSYNDLKTGIGKKGNKDEDSGRALITKYFDEYDIDVSFLRKEWDPKSQDDMFLRLQLGSPLKGVERRFGNTTNNIIRLEYDVF